MLMVQNHLEGLLKWRLLGPTPEFLIQEVWGGSKNLHLTEFPDAAGAAGMGHSLRTAGLCFHVIPLLQSLIMYFHLSSS